MFMPSLDSKHKASLESGVRTNKLKTAIDIWDNKVILEQFILPLVDLFYQIEFGKIQLVQFVPMVK